MQKAQQKESFTTMRMFVQHLSRFLFLALVAVMMFSLVSCTGSDDDDSTSPSDSAQADPNVLVYDTLKNGTTVGTINDGTFTDEGLQLHEGWGSVGYSIPTTPNGYAEFSVKGLRENEVHEDSEFKGVLFTMWSGTDGYIYYGGNFVYELRFFGLIPGRADATNSLSVRVLSNGEWEVGRRYVLGWDPNHTYRFRVEWKDGSTAVYRDDALVFTSPYRAPFSPNDHRLQIGGNTENPARRKESPHDLLISDVVIGILE